MANTKSAKKRARQTIRRTARNQAGRSRVKTALKTARASLQTGAQNLGETLKEAISTLQKAANKGLIHQRNASRRIGRLMKAPPLSRAPLKKPKPL